MSAKAWKPAKDESLQLTMAGYDGLYHPDEECGCEVGDLYPCGERPTECLPGFARREEGFPMSFIGPKEGK